MSNSPAVSFTAPATNFSFSLFQELSSSVQGNVFASTYSVHLIMLLLTLGSKSKTYDDIVSALRLPKGSPPNYEEIKGIIDYIQDPDYLTVANGIFTEKTFDLSGDFQNQARDYFKSEVRALDFTGNSTAGETEINEWTKNKTNGKISSLFDPGTISSGTQLVLASAVHFQNKWKNVFTQTKKGMFCLSAKEHIQIQMMHQTGVFKYYKDEENKFAAVELPYRDGFEMLILLPEKMDGVKSLENKFLRAPENFPILLANMTKHEVVLAVPKFKFESDINVENTLKNLGCGDMLTNKADFSKMSSSGTANLKVDSVKHKTFVDVNELGTEAAGVTGISMVLYSLPVQPPNMKTVHFHACHPFLFIIKRRDNIVFMGRLSNPNV